MAGSWHGLDVGSWLMRIESILLLMLLVTAGLPGQQLGVAQVAPVRTPVVAKAEEKSAFAITRVKPSPDSESDDWGIGLRGRNFWAVHVTLNELIAWAYGLNYRQIEGGPAWLGNERFDVDGQPEAGMQPTREQYRTMLQAALAERFLLKFHSSEKTMPVYVLSVASSGIKAPKSAEQGPKQAWGVHRGWLSIQNMTFGDAARVMQRTIFDRPVLDETGSRERFSFILKWRADETQFGQMQGVEMPQEKGTEDVDDIYVASRQQLGIRIEPKKALAPLMVVESVAHPTPN